jgi:hypothetical protein
MAIEFIDDFFRSEIIENYSLIFRTSNHDIVIEIYCPHSSEVAGKLVGDFLSNCVVDSDLTVFIAEC